MIQTKPSAHAKLRVGFMTEVMMIKPMRLMLYSHDGVGFGHLRRNLNIASHFVAQHPGSSVLMVAGFPGIPGIEIPRGVDLVKLPALCKTATNSWKPRSLNIEDRELARLRQSMMLSIVWQFTPDLFLADFLPAGANQELLQLLEVLKRKRNRPAIVLGLRDILGDPQAVRAKWEADGCYRVMLEFYDRVMIYGRREIFDTAESYGLCGPLADKVDFVNYVAPSPAPEPVKTIRERYRLNGKERLIVVTAGAGSDAFPMMRLMAAASPLLTRNVPARFVFVTGPLMGADKRKVLQTMMAQCAVQVVSSSDDVASLMNAADLLVCMGGYNTLIEALKLRKPTICIPREGPSAEQRMRAALFSRRGLCTWVPVGSSPQRLVDAMMAALRARRPAGALPWLDGAANTARELGALVSKRPKQPRIDLPSYVTALGERAAAASAAH